MDQVFIEGLTVNSIIGVYDYERTAAQPLVIDIFADYDTSTAANTDDLSYALDYAKISDVIKQFAKDNSFNLVETFANKLADILIAKFNLTKISLKIGKPNANPCAKLVGVQITRSSK